MAENNITQADVERLINSLRIPQKLKELLLKKPSMLTPVEEVTVSSLQEVYPVLKSIPKSPEEIVISLVKFSESAKVDVELFVVLDPM